MEHSQSLPSDAPLGSLGTPNTQGLGIGREVLSQLEEMSADATLASGFSFGFLTVIQDCVGGKKIYGAFQRHEAKFKREKNNVFGHNIEYNPV